MYRSDLNPSDRGSAIAAAVAIQVALLAAFLNMAAHTSVRDTQAPLEVVELPTPPPPPPVLPNETAKTDHKPGGSAPQNIKSEATPVVAPTPAIKTPFVRTVTTTQTPRQSVDATQGASTVRGTGTGAGGSGNGNGSGDGSGSGDGGGAVEPPHLATPVLRGYDFPPDLIDQWPRAATVFLRLKVDARGYVSECLLDRGTSVPQIDAQMCNTAHERLRFRPALNRNGQAVAGWFGYAQPAPR